MPYIPHTDADRAEMLALIGVDSIDDLFREIPPNLLLKPGELNIPSALDESRLFAHLRELSLKNISVNDVTCFLGAGIYDRFIPATVGAVISRGEYLTSYTPYQPEASQGYLQTIYEFQTMIAELYGMEVANASMYDASTAMAEAAIMAIGIVKRDRVAVSSAVHPHYREVLQTYAWALGLEVVTIDAHDGKTLDFSLVQDCACVIVQSPNFFGTIESLSLARQAATDHGALLVVVSDPISNALLKPPGAYGADIVVGEGQPMGIAMGFGGPLLGLFACKKEYVRQIPGRIVGKTTELHGDREGYVMTLRTREQDIRREKATSNICTNQALMALAATVYMTALGKNGLQQIATSSVRNAQYAIQALQSSGGKLRFRDNVFCEFVLDLPADAGTVRDELLKMGILAGLPLGDYYPGLSQCLLVAVTEMRTRDEIDRYAAALKKVLANLNSKPYAEARN